MKKKLIYIFTILFLITGVHFAKSQNKNRVRKAKRYLARIENSNRYSKRKKHYARYKLGKLYEALALNAIHHKQYDEANNYFYKIVELLERGIGRYGKDFKLGYFKIYKEALSYWVNNQYKKHEAYKHKILVMIIKGLDVNYKGKRYVWKKKKLTRKFPIYMNMLKIIFYYYSRGNMLLEYKIVNINSIAKKVSKRGFPLISSLRPYPSRLLWKNRNKCDTHWFVLPHHRPLSGSSRGGRGRVWFVPRKIRSRMKGIVKFNSGRLGNIRLMCHEFFHCFEKMNRRGPSHAFWRKRNWPSWYNGEGELHYYKFAFKKWGFTKNKKYLRFNRRRDKNSYRKFIRYLNLFLAKSRDGSEIESSPQ